MRSSPLNDKGMCVRKVLAIRANRIGQYEFLLDEKLLYNPQIWVAPASLVKHVCFLLSIEKVKYL